MSGKANHSSFGPMVACVVVACVSAFVVLGAAAGDHGGTDVLVVLPEAHQPTSCARVWAHNAGAAVARVQVRLLAEAPSNPNPLMYNSLIEPGQTAVWDDPLGRLFGAGEGRALRVVSDGRLLVNTGVTEPCSPVSLRTTVAPLAIPVGFAIGPGETSDLATASPARVTLAEVSGGWVEVDIGISDELGIERLRRRVRLGAGGVASLSWDQGGSAVALRAVVIAGDGRVVVVAPGAIWPTWGGGVVSRAGSPVWSSPESEIGAGPRRTVTPAGSDAVGGALRGAFGSKSTSGSRAGEGDVDGDGDADADDLACLAATIFDPDYGCAVAANDHDHWGQTWSGSGTGLTLDSSDGDALEVSGGDDAIFVSSAGDDGIYVGQADSGARVHTANQTGFSVFSAGTDGFFADTAGSNGFRVGSATNGVKVDSAGSDGVHVASAGLDGVRVASAGSPSTTTVSSSSNGFEIQGAEGNGLFVGHADEVGVMVGSASTDGLVVVSAGSPTTSATSLYNNGIEVRGAENAGLYVGHADEDGVHVGSVGSPSTGFSSGTSDGFSVAGTEHYGLWVGRADWDGVYVNEAGDNGITVESAGSPTATVSVADGNGLVVEGAGRNGLFVGHADLNGVVVKEAEGDGVWAETLDGAGEWGFRTPDKISSAKGVVSGGPQMVVALNGGDEPLTAGHVVVVSGMGAPFGDGDAPVPAVRRAGMQRPRPLLGVVSGRFVAREVTETLEGEDGTPETRVSLRPGSAPGAIAPGDHLLVVVLGAAKVKIGAKGEVRAGDLLAVSASGGARRLGEKAVVPPGSTLGTAMEPAAAAGDDGRIWALVMPR